MKYADLRARITVLEASLKECSEELSYWVEAEYPPERRKYPSQAAKYEAEMQTVHEARALLEGAQGLWEWDAPS